jgi:hypothetical protein
MVSLLVDFGLGLNQKYMPAPAAIMINNIIQVPRIDGGSWCQ